MRSAQRHVKAAIATKPQRVTSTFIIVAKYANIKLLTKVNGKDTGGVRPLSRSDLLAKQVEVFEGELHGVRSDLPDGGSAAYTVAVTDAVLQAVAQRRVVQVRPPQT